MSWWENLNEPILGRYRIERLLGEGGMARVFLATDVRNGRRVAFKTPKIEAFPPDSVNELLGRFNREFDSQANDPVQGVIPIYESGEFTDPAGVVRPFLAMQYLSGGSLGDALGGMIGRRERTQTLGEVLEWLAPIARTLDRLHARKYLHRDVKPDNILFNSDGDPFLADLGIVGTLDSAFSGSILGSTATGVLGSPGSPGYQSPESIQADPSLRNISASDQFSLAVTVYEALSGKLPANASTNQQWFGALINWTPTPLATYCPDLPPAAIEAVMKGMRGQSFERYTSCSEFAKALAASIHVAQPAAVAPKASTPPPPPLPATPVRGHGKAIAMGAVVVALLALGAYFLWPRTAPPTAAIPPAAKTPDVAPNAASVSTTAASGPAAAEPTGTPSWTVFFDVDKTNFGPESTAILDDAVTHLRRDRESQVLIVGHADAGEGEPRILTGISDRRAQAVRNYLVTQGIAPDRLRTEARGGTEPLAGTSVRGGNRRVELHLETSANGADASEPPPLEIPPPPERVAEAKPSAEDRRVCAADYKDEGVTRSILACTRIIELKGVSAADKAFALSYRGFNNGFDDDFPAAERDFSQALKLAPTPELQGLAHELRGRIRVLAGRESEGRADLAKATQISGITVTKAKGDWVVCISTAAAPDGALVVSTSALMDVHENFDYLKLLASERPDRPSLDAAGISRLQNDNGKQVDKFFGGCSKPRPTAEEGRAAGEEMVRAHDEKSRAQFANIRHIGGGWHIPRTITP